MSIAPARGAIGAPLDRVEGHLKVTGAADYAFERRPERLTYAWVVQATIAKGTVTAVHADEALALDGVLAVVSHENAPAVEQVADPELFVLQRPDVAYRNAIVAVVVAETLEAARDGAARVRLDYDAAEPDVVLTVDHPTLYAPDGVNGGYETDSELGDPDGALAAAPVAIDQRYSTPAFHNNAMEAPWVESCTTSPSPSQLATVACGSIALLWKAGVL